MMSKTEIVTMLTRAIKKMILSTNRMRNNAIDTINIINSIIITSTTTIKMVNKSTKKRKLKKTMMEKKLKSVMNTKVKSKWMMKKTMISKKMSTLRKSTSIP